MFLHIYCDGIRNKQTKVQELTSDDEDVEKLELFCTIGGNVKWCNHCGKHYGNASKT